MPRRGEPGSTHWSSSVTTRVSWESENEAVSTAPLAEVIEAPMLMASEEAKVSTRYTAGWWRSRPSLVLADHMTPEDTIIFNDVRSHRPGDSSSARRIGLAKASPTITNV